MSPTNKYSNRLQNNNTGHVSYEDALKHAIDYSKNTKAVGSIVNQINQRGLGNNIDSENSHKSISPIGR